jgi:puromycin-sensitive aminopeptidase
MPTTSKRTPDREVARRDGGAAGTTRHATAGTIAAMSATTAAPPDHTELDPYRLPTDVVPTRYDVRLRPLLDAATFTGSVAVDIDVHQPTARIVLNADELDIAECSIDGAPVEWELEPATERLFVHAPDPIAVGAHRLEIRFAGMLNDKLRGFYRSTYVDADGVQHTIATTQMQATDCRRAFPCWDEPAMKAVFGITLDVDHGLTAISNGPEIERTDGEDGTTSIRFADTMPMSTYLVAFVVGRLEVTDPVDVDGVPLRIVHVPGKGDLTAFGLEVGAFSLRWFQDYYGIAYPGEKVDLVALPDFAAGAMENLGCITFRESLLLADPATSTQNDLQLVADVVAHEVAHMWFGDLVTMRWWNGIWLNEAFATFMQTAACDAFRPDWERWTSFGLERTVAFETDSLASTRPVEYEVRSPADCDGMFDVLTYQKGGALLRMLEQYLGPERFREGVSQYLRTHAYGNTETNDLWDAIEGTSGEPVRRLMDSWIWQPGYPEVSASSITDGAGNEVVRLRQRRFLFAADLDSADVADPTTWVIPIHVRSGDADAPSTEIVLLDADAVDVPIAAPGTTVVVNAGGHGFVRVTYDDELRARLTGEALTTLSTIERYNLVDDAWAATVAGRMGANDLLEFLEGFGDERELAVWQAINFALRGLVRILDDDAVAGLATRVRTLVEPALTELGDPADDEPDMRRKLRGHLVTMHGGLGADERTGTRCAEWFARSLTDRSAVDPELTSAATAVVAARGDAADYDTMFNAFDSAPTPQEQLRLMYALAEFDDPDLVDRTCELATSGAVKTQNAPFLLGRAMANRRHGARAWDFVRRRWDELNTAFPSNTIVRMVEPIRLLNQPDVVADVQAFFAEHPIEQARKTLDQLLERQRINAALREREGAALSASLRAL